MKIQTRSLVVITITFIFLVYRITAFAGVSCSDLALQPYGGATITSVTMVPTDGDTPAYCKVTATAGLQTDIEVRLPDNWQKRYLHIGGGGFDGAIPDYLDRLNIRLQQGYAIAASNGGHRASNYPEGTFGIDYALTQDYAYVAIGNTVRVAKALIAAYYGERPKYSYWNGCSNGGREGYNAAAKYPNEFDGVIAAAPTRNWAGAIASWMQNLPAVNLTSDKVVAVYLAGVAACDKLDGLEDGIISNPEECNFDPATVPELSDTEVAIVKNLFTDITLSDGTLIYSRYGLGLLIWTDAYRSIGLGSVRYIVYRDPAYDPATWNLDNDYPAVKSVIEQVYDFNVSTEALASYLKSGKKLIVWHGTDDTAISHYDTIRSMEELANAAGSYGRANMKLYIAPGVGHCSGGAGADLVDMLTPLTNWVEKGKAPKTLIAYKFDTAGKLVFTRPLCEYPRYPRYISGDPNKAISFICQRPKRGEGKRSTTPVKVLDVNHAEMNRALKAILPSIPDKALDHFDSCMGNDQACTE